MAATSTSAHAGWAGHAMARLAAAGFRRGGAREAVIEVLASESCGLGALEIDERLRAGGRRVGRASVYRTLEQLEELGLVHRLDIGGALARFERVEPGGEHHHHMVCDRCGKVLPFSDEALERAVARVSGGARFEVRDHEVVLRGACGSCRG